MTDRKLGRAIEKGKRYRAAHTCERNKAKRILQSNGLKACQAYCQLHGILTPKHSRIQVTE